MYTLHMHVAIFMTNFNQDSKVNDIFFFICLLRYPQSSISERMLMGVSILHFSP